MEKNQNLYSQQVLLRSIKFHIEGKCVANGSKRNREFLVRAKFENLKSRIILPLRFCIPDATSVPTGVTNMYDAYNSELPLKRRHLAFKKLISTNVFEKKRTCFYLIGKIVEVGALNSLFMLTTIEPDEYGYLTLTNDVKFFPIPN